MKRAADLLFSRLADLGVRHVFLVTGGGAMFLDDAVRRESRLSWTCHHHEQAAAMAAEGYARMTGVPAVVCVTTGPGGINALNGVFGAWTDSIPMIVVSGQVKRGTCMSSYPGLGLRQLGDQEADIVSIASGIVKLACRMTEPADVRYLVEKAHWSATHGRQGPVWLDVPLDVQSSEIDPERLRGFVAPHDDRPRSAGADFPGLVDRIEAAERPVLLAGTGVRLAGAQDVFLSVAEQLRVPVTTAWTHDLIATDHPLWCGRPGTIGDRAGNFAVQAADLLVVIGSRLNVRQTGYDWSSFAPHAFKVQVDVDPAELCKPTVRPDQPVAADAGDFLRGLDAELRERAYVPGRHSAWLAWCRRRTQAYPVVQPKHRRHEPPINPYHFIETLFEHLGPRDVVVTANGAACVMSFQAARLGPEQRLFSNSGSASMGYDLPAALGAAVAVAERSEWSGITPASGSRRRVVCLAGDGSLQMNVQELQTLATHGWPVSVFVLDNGGYLSIRSTQANFFDGFIGEGPGSGLGLPDWVSVASAFGIDSARIDQPVRMGAQIAAALAGSGPSLAHVVVDPGQGFEPRVMSRQLADGRIVSPALDDLYPFLEPEEAASNRVGPDGHLPG
jgi:acetolactate synthase-1/2/3 large subunit